MRLIDTLPSPVNDLLHGETISDPYRWLENRYLPSTENWIAIQKQRSTDYFEGSKSLELIRDRVARYLTMEVVDQCAEVKDRFFYRKRTREDEHAKLYMSDRATGKEHILVDPILIGANCSVRIHRIANSASLMAYELKSSGGDRKSIHLVDVESGRILPSGIANGYARGFCFSSDNSSFFYCQEVDEVTEHRIVHRVLGETQEDIVFRLPRRAASRLILIDDNVHLGAVCIHQTSGKEAVDLWIADRKQPRQWRCLFADRQSPYTPILSFGRIFAFVYDGAPNGRLVELNRNGEVSRTVIPESGGVTREFLFASGTIFKNCIRAMRHVVEHWSVDGVQLATLDLPGEASIRLHTVNSDMADSIFMTMESAIQPPVIVAYSVKSGEVNKCCEERSALSPAPRFQTRSYVAKDGTIVPITLIAPEVRSALAPRAIMTSYGGFAVGAAPRFSAVLTIMNELGLTIAVPHIRGGGEFGRDWHEQARGRRRQIAFDDFLGAAEWLHSNEIASPGGLAIVGGSNGGLLVAAAMTQKPELFGAVVCVAPLLDMLRYERFDQAARWRHEYGSVEDFEDFKALYAYSPYHHVRDDVDYPSILFVSGDQDDRCNPAHVRKMAALLHDRDSQRHPVLVDYSDQRGHSAGLPLSVRIDALARRIDFLCRELQVPVMFGGRDDATSN